jgi:hypothetical protein
MSKQKNMPYLKKRICSIHDPESLNPETSMDPDDPRLITNLQTELADLDKENDEFTSSEYMLINKKFF